MATAEQVLAEFPHLASPLHLAQATWPQFRGPPHIRALCRELMDVQASGGGSRVMVNMPYQHGKSWLASKAFPAWVLLLFPDTRITLIGHGEEFAASEFGSVVKELVERWGPELGINLREDTKAKGNWKVEGHEGGMYCTGPGGGAQGRPADLFLVDDLIKEPTQALSPTILESHWAFYETVIQSRLRNETNFVVVSTRWCRRDLCGRLLDAARKTGRVWRVVKFKALAEEDDPLGRPVGAPLWPENVSLQELLEIRMTNRWWKAGWQQDPEDEEGQYFRPRTWPSYQTAGPDLYSVPYHGFRQALSRNDLTLFCAVDWAYSEKKGSDFTAVLTLAVIPDGRMLVLDVVNCRVPLEGCVLLVAESCRKHRPQFVVAESGGFQDALLLECARNHDVPEVRPVSPGGKTKLQRAYQAVILGENGKILLPDVDPGWLSDFRAQLSSFTGLSDGHDDMVDALAYAAHVAGELQGVSPDPGACGPCVLIPGREGGFNF